MNKNKIIVIICLLYLTIGCKINDNKEFADMVLLNANIITMDSGFPHAEALAIKDNIILELGSEKMIKKFISDSTKIIDLNGQFTIPGLIDGHGHYMSLGESLMGIDLKKTKNWEEIVELVAEEVKKTGPGEWIFGRGWHQDKWNKIPEPNIEGIPLNHQLSNISPDNPVLLIHVSGHGVIVNDRALKESGITSETPDPDGGEIVHDKDGQPTGMLRETAQDIARDALANFLAKRPQEVIIANERKKVKLAAEEAIRNGITTFFDMGETFETPVEDINPIFNFYCMVTRKMENGKEFYPEQKLTRMQALQSYTVNNAYSAFEEDIKGTLAKGKLADITVLSQDLLTIPDNEILDTEIIYTIIGGKIKYQR